MRAATHLRGRRGLAICRICPRQRRSDRGGHCLIQFSRGRIEAMVSCDATGYFGCSGKVESRWERWVVLYYRVGYVTSNSLKNSIVVINVTLLGE